MARQIIINSTPQEARVATMENARLLEIRIERLRERGIAGSIYKGRVNRVLPGMQAAFVDIGLPKAAFLASADLYPLNADEYALRETPFEQDETQPPVPAADRPDAPKDNAVSDPSTRPLPAIEERLAKGNEVLAQIAKEPMGTKGARITSNISLPGRYLVYLPRSSQVGVSRRIGSEEERQRLREAVASVKSVKGGVIIRTACEGVSKREIQSDLRLLNKLWTRLSRRAESHPAPSLLHQDLDVMLRTLRDLSTADVTRVVVDNRRDHHRIVDFIESVMPRWRPRVEFYERSEPIFERYGIEAQIAKALQRKVWLKSGGYIVIDHTEALTAVDVNTGRFVGKTDHNETALRTNLEAARVTVDQLRLRNIGGLIIIDFIDMESSNSRKAVLCALTDALKSDRARTNIVGFSELGLVEMTRQRTRESLAQQMCEPCPSCGESGRTKSTATTTYEVLRRIRREVTINAPLAQVVVALHPTVAAFLAQYEPVAVRELERELQVEIVVNQTNTLALTEYAVNAVAAVPGAG